LSVTFCLYYFSVYHFVRYHFVRSPFALFVIATYTKYRFESPVSTAAPRNDLVHMSEKGS